MPTDRAFAGSVADRLYGAGDRPAFGRLVHVGVAFPSPAMGGDFVATAHGVLCQLRRTFDGAAELFFMAGKTFSLKYLAVPAGLPITTSLASARTSDGMAKEAASAAPVLSVVVGFGFHASD